MSSSRLIELDVEGLAHMGAARAQDLHHLVLVPHRVELRFHRLRLGHHLAQRKRGGENLDQDSFHLRGGAIAGFEGRSFYDTRTLYRTC